MSRRASAAENHSAYLQTPVSQSPHGFTLIEVMISMAIIGTLAAIALPNYIRYREKAKITRAIAEIRSIEQAIQFYTISNSVYPDNLSQLYGAVPLDPWGHPYQYIRIDGGNTPKGILRKDKALVPVNDDFDLYSKGADGQSSAAFTAKTSQDDIVRCNDGGYVGLVSDY
jgi:general secretion pathway protein G